MEWKLWNYHWYYSWEEYFTVSDTGIDYSLWNPDHPSGSAYYGEAIENLPSLEALPNASYFMRNNLVSLGGDRNVTELAYVLLYGEGIGTIVSKDFGDLRSIREEIKEYEPWALEYEKGGGKKKRSKGSKRSKRSKIIKRSKRSKRSKGSKRSKK